MQHITRLALSGVFALFLAAPVLPQTANNAYLQHNLVADTAGTADFTDPNLINPWGIAISATSPFWVNDQGTGLSTVYNSTGTVLSVKATVPPAAGGTASHPTGIVYNGTTGFALAPGKPPAFIFATEDGTISGWASSVDATHAINKVDNSAAGAVYKGLAIGGPPGIPLIYAANFYSGGIEVYDGNYNRYGYGYGFTDPAIPAGFAPFNIQNLNGKLYVTYAKQDSAKHNDVAGPGNGYIDVYDMNGNLLQSLVTGGPLNSPWGLAIAPANFGPFSNDLLVGNFGDGLINAFDPATGTLVGTLKDPSGNPISISGLWGLQAGNGKNGGDANAVYFAAGTGGQAHGLFGSLQAAPVLGANSVVNGATFQPGIAQNTWISLGGANLAATTRAWKSSDFTGSQLPAALDGVAVTVNGKPAYVAYVSPVQVNVLTPVDTTLGPVPVTISNHGLTSTVSVTLAAYAPRFFALKDPKYIAAMHSDNVTVVGPTTLYPNVSTPAKPGETIVLYATGFGATTPPIPDGQILSSPYLLSGVIVQIGGVSAQVAFAGLTAPGLYQLNVVVPDTTPDGDAAVMAQIGDSTTQVGVFIAVQK